MPTSPARRALLAGALLLATAAAGCADPLDASHAAAAPAAPEGSAAPPDPLRSDAYDFSGTITAYAEAGARWRAPPAATASTRPFSSGTRRSP